MKQPGTPQGGLAQGLIDLDVNTIAELLRRMRDIDQCYRTASEMLGQLYMLAGDHQAAALTRRLDQPMRNASQNQRDFAALVDEVHRLTQTAIRPAG